MGTWRTAYHSTSLATDVVRTCDHCRRPYRIGIRSSGWGSVTAGREAARVARGTAESMAQSRLLKRKHDPTCGALCPHCGAFMSAVMTRFFRKGIDVGVRQFLRREAGVRLARIVAALIIPMCLFGGMLYLFHTQPQLPAESRKPASESSLGFAVVTVVVISIPLVVLVVISMVQSWHLTCALRAMHRLQQVSGDEAMVVVRDAYRQAGHIFDAVFRQQLVKRLLIGPTR